MLGFNTVDIQKGMDRIRQIAILVSLIVFCIGILLGLWLARTISTPVRQIRDAAILVGKGDLTQHVGQNRRDEIGDLSRAFNKMVGDLSKAEEEIRTKNSELTLALDDLNIKNKQIVLEKQKSDELLLNILPEETAEELKTEGHAKPKRFEMATVMFTDFVSFTRISEGLSPEQLVSEIDYCFSNFDEIIEKYQVEKIKTIGDSYMCVGGIPVPQKNHASNCILAALEIQEFLNMNQKDRGSKSHPSFVARVGIHSGPLVAGIVGSKKFAYDVWGDTVNTASRMESSGEADMVNISVETYKLLKDDPRFHFKYRGKVKAKGKGEIEMYFVSLTKKTSEF
jgi:class 3 adenylate cyclase/HAMP domain-containing protein